MPDFTDPLVIDALVEKAIEYAPLLAICIGLIVTPIWYKVSNKTDNSQARFNVSKYIQEFDRVKQSNNINKNKNNSNGVF